MFLLLANMSSNSLVYAHVNRAGQSCDWCTLTKVLLAQKPKCDWRTQTKVPPPPVHQPLSCAVDILTLSKGWNPAVASLSAKVYIQLVWVAPLEQRQVGGEDVLTPDKCRYILNKFIVLVLLCGPVSADERDPSILTAHSIHSIKFQI